jgi:hypothetical protein
VKGIRPLKIIVILSLFFFSWLNGYTQDNTPKYSNEFLAIGVGARALGMANAQVGITDDVTSAYWNPAGLTDIADKYEVSLMHASYFAGIANYDYVGFAMPVDSSNFIAFSLIRFAVDDIPDTRFLYDANGAINYDNIRYFSAADYAFLFSYARKLKVLKGLQLGGNFKVIHRSAGEFANAWGFGLDAGAKLRVGHWFFGAMFRDIFGTFTAWTHNPDLLADVYTQTGNTIPENSIEITVPRLVLSAGYDFKFGDKIGLLLALDLETTFDGKRNTLLKSNFASVDPRFGLELDYQKTAFLRLGIGNIQEIKNFDQSTSTTLQPNFGLGVKVKFVTIDYALTDIGDLSEGLYSHIFSIKAGFGK